MEIQNQVGRSLRGNLTRLREVLDGAVSQGVDGLGQVADRVCEAFDFRDGRGRLQRASCCAALADLEAGGHIWLPRGRPARGGVWRPRVLAQPVAPAVDVPGTVGEVRGLALVRVETDEQRRVWNTLMAQEHPRGAGPFVGPQLRYLVGSGHGWLGGVGFAACARRLRVRDAWIGWDDTGRRAHLHRVLGLCRLLVRPGVECRNLASHVLGRAARAVGNDCEHLYGYRPWLLETFVDETHQTGASVRAANWVRVGETSGRGRQDRTHAASETRKAVYMYALEPAWRDTLPVVAPDVVPLGVGDGLDAASWADHEFGGARLGDARLSARLVRSARQMGESPLRAMPGAAKGTRALVKGHYRLIDQPAESAVTVDNMLAPHRERTLRRMRAHETVLCIQDGTRLNFTRRSQTEGLGVIGSNQTGAVARGLDLHTTLAVNPDGVALGVLRAAFDAPEPPNPEAKGQPKPREARKSFRWVEGLRDLAAAAERLGETRVVCTMDREADFLDLFIERRANAPRVDLLVRAKVDRVVGREKTADGRTVSRRLFDQVRDAPACGTARVEVQRLSARVKASKQPPKDARAARVAEVTLRYRQVSLPCPDAEPVELVVVHAREQQPPPAVKPLEWFVLTTLPVTSAADATRILGWYALRWRIEDYFRVIKSGCKVEELQHHTAERLERAIAIKMVVGWRIQLMVQLGRETPDLPGDLLFSDSELRVLATFARSRDLPAPTRLGDAVGLVARLGGWLGRKRAPPGAQLLWYGYTKLVAMSFAFELRDEFG
ncbi:MAG: IS4 family transposase [Deltaproteobacteria bacterium]|nr:IS4 family transposase [Deltaproteobacteria bacterium]